MKQHCGARLVGTRELVTSVQEDLELALALPFPIPSSQMHVLPLILG